MKSPLRYQATEYDCGPTTMLNAIMYMFDREEIPPDLVRHIGICTLDSYDRAGRCGRYGTSSSAIRYFCSWLNEMRYSGLLPVSGEYLEQGQVFLGIGSRVSRAISEGDAVMLHIFRKQGHYVLVTGECEEGLKIFDPYYGEPKREGIIRVTDQPFSHNLIVPAEYLQSDKREYYSMGEIETREAMIIGRADIEYQYVI